MAIIIEPPHVETDDVDTPSENERVSLAFDDHSIAGVLREWDHGAEMIELDHPAPVPLPRRGRVQYFSRRGIVRQHGSLALAAPDSSRGVRFEPSGLPQLLLARQHLRAELTVPVVVHRSDGTERETMSLDLSESGALLELGEPLEVGEHLDLQMRVERFYPAIVTHSVVVRLTDDGHAAIHHTQIDREDLERLCWRIFNHLLYERAQRRE